MSTQLNVIKPSVKIYPASYNAVQKVAEMARICYRSEKNSGTEADAKLINGCIKRGHTSVTEHGYMSIVFGEQKLNLKSLNNPQMPGGFSTAQLWMQYHSPDINKYIEVYGDDQIYKKIDGTNAEARVYGAFVGNFRAWLNILDDCMAASIQNGFALGVAFIGGIIVKADKVFPEIFGQLKDKVNTAFSQAKPDHYLRKEFMPEGCKDTDPLTIEHLSKYYNLFEITVAQTTPRYSLSVVMRTDRAVSHECVRHRRDTNYSQESQRWVNYNGKGFDVIHLAMDPVKYSLAKFAPVEGTELLSLDDAGFVPEGSRTFAKWKKSMERTVEEYLDFTDKNNGDIIVPGNENQESINIGLPPEAARTILQNSFATTLGVTWTPATFVNLMRWRLDKNAYWPFRNMMGHIVLECLKEGHEFFENFPPAKITEWIEACRSNKILGDEDLYKELIEAQMKRQANLDKAREEIKNKMMEELKKRQEAQQKAAENKDAPKSEPACVIAPTAEQK